MDQIESNISHHLTIFRGLSRMIFPSSCDMQVIDSRDGAPEVMTVGAAAGAAGSAKRGAAAGMSCSMVSSSSCFLSGSSKTYVGMVTVLFFSFSCSSRMRSFRYAELIVCNRTATIFLCSSLSHHKCAYQIVKPTEIGEIVIKQNFLANRHIILPPEKSSQGCDNEINTGRMLP